MTFGFSPEVEAKLSELLSPSGVGKRALFDADGTLWRGDIGDEFFSFMHRGALYTNAPGAPEHWPGVIERALADGRVAEAYGWHAQWLAGAKEDDVRFWAKQAKDRFFPEQKIFTPVRLFIDALHARGWEVWVVSASPWWVVVEGVATLGIAPNRVIATKVDVNSKGVLTDQLSYPTPYAEGKALAWQSQVGKPAAFSAGNSMGDVALLSLATDCALAITSTKTGDHYWTTEQGLQDVVAKQRRALTPLGTPHYQTEAGRVGIAKVWLSQVF